MEETNMDKEQTEMKSSAKPGEGGSRQGKAESSSVAARSHEAAESIKDAAVEKLQSAYASAESVKGQAVERVRKLGSAVRKVGEHLRVEDQEKLAGYAADASQRIEDLASYIDTGDLGSFVRDTEQFARRSRPLFFGGAFVMGLAAGRFLRSSGASVRSMGQRPGASSEWSDRSASSARSESPAQRTNVSSDAADTTGANRPRRQGGASS
jgi:hypothetical protein